MGVVLPALLRQIGILSAYTVVVAALLKWFGEKIVTRYLESKIDEGVKRRTAQLQFDLDSRLATVRSELERDADRLRSQLTREASDFSIWAQRRHEATATLFATYLECEVLATNLSDFAVPILDDASHSDLLFLAERHAATPEELTALTTALAANESAIVEDRLRNVLRRARDRQLTRARNAAYDAYFKAALYLSDEVDQAAIAVRDQFHMILVSYFGGTERNGEFFANKTKMRLLMLEYMNKARADLGRAAHRLQQPESARSLASVAPVV
jgi:hypothetical protein